MKKLLCIILLVFTMGCAPTTQQVVDISVQQKCDAPVWNVGDTWRFRYATMKEWQITVESTEGNLYILEDRYGVDKPCFDKRTLELKYFINPQGRKVTSETVWFYGIYCNFPVYVGKKWSKMVSGKDAGGVSMDYLHEFKVLSLEEVTVPAGTFKAFKIEFSKRIATRASDVYRHYVWYSPEVKTIIKSSYAGHEGRWKPGSWDFALISFKLKDNPPSPLEKKFPAQEGDNKPQVTLPEKPLILKPATPPPATNIVIVTGTSANIRSGAGNEFPAVAIVKQGDKLILLGEYGEWFNVRLETGQEGWINRRFVKK